MLVDSDEHGILLAFSVSKQFKQFRSLLPVQRHGEKRKRSPLPFHNQLVMIFFPRVKAECSTVSQAMSQGNCSGFEGIRHPSKGNTKHRGTPVHHCHWISWPGLKQENNQMMFSCNSGIAPVWVSKAIFSHFPSSCQVLYNTLLRCLIEKRANLTEIFALLPGDIFTRNNLTDKHQETPPSVHQ